MSSPSEAGAARERACGVPIGRSVGATDLRFSKENFSFGFLLKNRIMAAAWWTDARRQRRRQRCRWRQTGRAAVEDTQAQSRRGDGLPARGTLVVAAGVAVLTIGPSHSFTPSQRALRLTLRVMFTAWWRSRAGLRAALHSTPDSPATPPATCAYRTGSAQGWVDKLHKTIDAHTANRDVHTVSARDRLGPFGRSIR